MFYDTFINLCAEKGKRPSDVSRELGIGKSTISMWKKQNSIPNAVTLMQLAEYFNVAPAYLAGNPMAKNPLYSLSSDQKEKPTVNKDDEQTNDDPITQEIIKKVKQLSLDKQERVAGYIDSLTPKDEKQN